MTKGFLCANILNVKHRLLICAFVLGVLIQPANAQQLIASWYDERSLKDEGTWKRTQGVMSNGRRFDENADTCATRIFPLDTVLLIRRGTLSCRVVVTDRTAKKYGSRIDLSRSAFAKIADLRDGIVEVDVYVVDGSRNIDTRGQKARVRRH